MQLGDQGLGDRQPEKKKKKAVHWSKDPEILFRLDTVAAMMLEGAKPYQIAYSMGYDWNTAKRDMDRVEELWRQQQGKKIADKRATAVAQWQHVKMHAWEQFRKTKGVVWLRAISEAQANIDLIEGNRAPKEVKVGIELSEEAERALAILEAQGIQRDELWNAFNDFIVEAGKEYSKSK